MFSFTNFLTMPSSVSEIVALFSRLFSSATLGDNATFTRSSTATVESNEDPVLIRNVLSGEARFNGGRRVENLFENTEDFSQSNWLASLGCTKTVKAGIGPNGEDGVEIYLPDVAAQFDEFTVSAGFNVSSYFVRTTSGTGQFRIRIGGNFSGNLTATTSWQRFCYTNASAVGTGNTARSLQSNNVGDAVTIQMCMPLCENVNGRTDTTTPSEYVSKGVLSTPYHGANVDGVKYFSTENGNSVASNIVTEGTGAAISGISLLLEPASTNLSLYSEDLSNAAWVATNTTKGSTSQTAPDGSANTTCEVTASAGNGTLLQTVTSASATRTYSVYLKRKTGTGNIDMTVDGGSTWTTKTITSSFARYSITQAAVTNPQFGIRIVTSGDAVYMWGSQVESQSLMSSYIKTTTVAVTRAADTAVSYSLTTPQTAGMAIVELSGFSTTAPGTQGILGFTAASTTSVLYRTSAATPVYSSDGTNTSETPAIADGSAVTAVAARWGSSTITVGYRTSGGWTWDATPATYDGAWTSDNTLQILKSVAEPYNISNVVVYDSDQGTSWIEANY